MNLSHYRCGSGFPLVSRAAQKSALLPLKFKRKQGVAAMAALFAPPSFGRGFLFCGIPCTHRNRRAPAAGLRGLFPAEVLDLLPGPGLESMVTRDTRQVPGAVSLNPAV